MLPLHLIQKQYALENDDPNPPLDTPLEEDCVESPMLVDPSIVQQSTRSTLDGQDCISVTSRITIDAGADREVFHFPIQPPMNSTPLVDAYVVSGADVRIRVTQRQRFGVRVELILGQPADTATESVVEFILRPEEKESVCPSRPEAA